MKKIVDKSFVRSFSSAIVGILLVLNLSSCTSRSTLPRRADKLADEMYAAYYQKDIEEAIAAAKVYYDFLNAHQRELDRSRDIESMQESVNSKLVIMYLALGDHVLAAEYLDEAFRFHCQRRQRLKTESVSRDAFLDFVLDSNRKFDARFSVTWQKKHSIESKTIEQTKRIFVGQRTEGNQ